MIRINLLPYWEKKKKAGIQRQIILISTIVAVFVIVLAAVHLYMTFSIKALELQVKASEAELAKLTKITGDVARYKKDKALVQKKLKIITDLERNRMDPVYIMDEIATRIPENKVWLTYLDEKSGGLTLSGIAMNNSDIALFMMTLEASRFIATVDLISAEQITISNVKVMKFNLSCKLKKE
jgi:type IV pilus assembly protein PilN